jgi:mRNA interferase RelE/StbE
MAAALQVYYTSFDAVFLKLPPVLRHRVEDKIDEMGLSLDSYPHYRLTGSNRYRLRVGDYRIIYTFDTTQNAIHLLAIGHRREIYRGG